MAREIPKAPKVRTTNYTNFKGVDFTNDPTNVWYRRSPDGVNMLPDDAGRPFKRVGWEIAVDAGTLASIISADELRILKCHYFELAGVDHILIFTDGGVFRYADVNGDGVPEVEILDQSNFPNGGDSKDIDCCSSYDRAFFFEGNGTAGFYIYGNYKVWVYGYNTETESFTFNLAKDGFDVGNITIPTVLASTDPSSCTGTVLYPYNLIGSKASVEYPSNAMFYSYTTSTNITFTATDQTKFTTNATYVFTYSSSQWNLVGYSVSGGVETAISGSNVNMSTTYGITINGTPEEDDKIVVINMYGVLLPNNVTQYQVGEKEVEVYPDFQTRPEHSIDVLKEYDTSTPPNRVHPTDDTECVLHTDVESPNNKAWVEFYSSIADAEQKDIIRVVFPVATVTIHSYTDEAPISQTITINGKR